LKCLLIAKEFILSIFSNSFFNTEDVEDKSNAPTVTSGVNINKHTFKDLGDVQRSYPKNFMAAHLFTINSTLISLYWFGTFPTRIFYWTRIS
jgi:hypothetical protein